MTKPKTVTVRHTPREGLLGSWPRLGLLRDEIDRLFDNFDLRAPEIGWPFGGAEDEPGALWPAMDLTEADGVYTIRVEVPGIEADAIEVKISDGMLDISGEKTEEKEEKDARHHLRERRWGSFRRAMRLPGNVDQDKIEASHANGVLTLRLPKTSAAPAAEKSVKIKAA